MSTDTKTTTTRLRSHKIGMPFRFFAVQRLLTVQLLRRSFLVLLLCSPLAAQQAPPNQSASSSSSPAIQADLLIEKLSDPSYSTRQLAKFRLLQLGGAAISSIEAASQTSDPDLAENLIHLLSDLAIDPNQEPGSSAVRSLRKIGADTISIAGMLAKRSVDSIEKAQSEIVAQDLLDLGGQFGTGTQILTSRADNKIYLELGDDFLGNEKDLERLQWLRGIHVLILRGDRVNGEWLKMAALVPDLPALKIQNAKLQGKDLAYLRNSKHLEILELIYVDVDDSAIDPLKTLPVWNAIRLFGTKVSLQGDKALREALPDLDIIYGRGGFLGVSINQANGVEIGSVTPNGAAAEAGLMADDRILAINDVPLKKFEDLRRELAKFGVGDAVDVTLERRIFPQDKNPEKLTIKVKLGVQP